MLYIVIVIVVELFIAIRGEGMQQQLCFVTRVTRDGTNKPARSCFFFAVYEVAARKVLI